MRKSQAIVHQMNGDSQKKRNILAIRCTPSVICRDIPALHLGIAYKD